MQVWRNDFPAGTRGQVREAYSCAKDMSSHLWWNFLWLQICVAPGYTCQGMDPFLASFCCKGYFWKG